MSKFHYYMVVGTLMFHEAKDPEGIGSTTLNAIIASDTKDIRVKEIGKAQTALQQQLHNRTPGVLMNVVDVTLMNFIYLGHLTQEEFNVGLPANDPA